MALVLLEGAVVEIVRVAVAAVLLLSVTEDGEMLQVAPGMFADAQLRFTVLV
jgi:hypothetical protein